MRQVSTRPIAVAALVGAWLAGGCAPSPFSLCNSDDDCTRRELCVDGMCGAMHEPASADTVAPRGRAAQGELIIDLSGDDDVTTPSPEPEPGEPAPPPPGAPVDPPDDWLDPGFEHRAIVTIVGVDGVDEERVDDLAVLVRLREADLGAAALQAARARVLFTTVDHEPLAAELDSDRGQELLYWVRHSFDPRAGQAEPERLYVYVGGDAAVAAPSSSEAWSSYFAVYHLGAPRNLPQPDSTGASAGVNEDAEAETVPCTVGPCLFFDGLDDRMVVPRAFPELAGATQATLSATVRMSTADDSFIAVWSTADEGRCRVCLGTNDDGVPQAAVRANDASPVLQVAEGGPPLQLGIDHQLDAVLDMVAGTISLFVDGHHRATKQFLSPGALSASDGAAAAVGAAAGPAAAAEFDGLVDEVRISTRRRSPGFVRVDAAARAGLLTTVALDR